VLIPNQPTTTRVILTYISKPLSDRLTRIATQTLVLSQFFLHTDVRAKCVPTSRDAGAGCVERSFDDIRIVSNIMVLSFGESTDEYAGQVHVVISN
jgi:hypothetical protein